MNRRRTLAPCLLAATFASTALATEVRVVDPAGVPVQDAVVLCNGRSKGAVGTNENGIATIVDGCRKVQCVQGDFITGEAAISAGKTLCRLGAGVHVDGEIDVKVCGESYSAALIDIHTRRGADTVQARPRDDGRACNFRSRTVPPGGYMVLIERGDDGWSCATDLGELAAGPQHVSALWREPVAVDLKVVGRDGKAARGVAARIVPKEKGEAGPLPEAGRCRFLLWGEDEPVTNEKGEIRLLVDPADPPAVVEVGQADDPVGFASVPLDPHHRGKLVIALHGKPDDR